MMAPFDETVMRICHCSGGRRDLSSKNAYSQRAERTRERELSEQAEVAYRRLVADWKAMSPTARTRRALRLQRVQRRRVSPQDAELLSIALESPPTHRRMCRGAVGQAA